MKHCFLCSKAATEQRDGFPLCAKHAAKFDQLKERGLSEERDNPVGAMWAGDSPEWTV